MTGAMSERDAQAGEKGTPPERLFGHPGAETLDTTLLDNVDRQWGWHLDVFRSTVRPGCTSPGVGLPEPLTMTVEEYTVYPPEHHLPKATDIVEWLVEMAAENETDEGWYEQAEDATASPTVLAIAEALRLAVAQGIRYRMAADLVATWTITRTAKWEDGHSGRWFTEDSGPPPVGSRDGER